MMISLIHLMESIELIRSCSLRLILNYSIIYMKRNTESQMRETVFIN